MKKSEIIKIWKERYNLDSRTVLKVLEFVFGLSKEKVFLLDKIEDIYLWQIIFIFERLFSGYPLAYITKKVNFMGHDFFVDENVLIPRDDTEILVREVVNTESKWQVLLDIWTWSGIIPISLAKKVEFKQIFAIDVSEKAIKVAKENVFRHYLEEKIKFINTDFRKFDFDLFKWENLIVTANLPYIKEGDFENMDFWVYKFEPKTALYGWKDTWFELYEELIKIFLERRNLFNCLTLFIEIGFDQYEISKNFLLKKWLKFEFFKDTNNIHRVIKIIL